MTASCSSSAALSGGEKVKAGSAGCGEGWRSGAVAPERRRARDCASGGEGGRSWAVGGSLPTPQSHPPSSLPSGGAIASESRSEPISPRGSAAAPVLLTSALELRGLLGRLLTVSILLRALPITAKKEKCSADPPRFRVTSTPLGCAPASPARKCNRVTETLSTTSLAGPLR